MRVYSRVCGLLTPTWHVRMPHRFSVQTQHRHSQLEGRSRRRSLCSAIPGRVFVTPEWLLAHLNDVAIIDVRGEVNTDASALGVERSHCVSEDTLLRHRTWHTAYHDYQYAELDILGLDKRRNWHATQHTGAVGFECRQLRCNRGGKRTCSLSAVWFVHRPNWISLWITSAWWYPGMKL